MPGDIIPHYSVKKQVNTLLLFQVILTSNNGAHAFVIFSVFAAHLTDDLNPRSPVYSILHVR
jgi:hypothetical protein